jgi:uncharacterized protein (TIGR03790 family)
VSARRLVIALIFLAAARAQTGSQVLLVVNRKDAASREVGDYYRPRRSIPVDNVCWVETTSEEEISWDVFEQEIEKPIAKCLERGGLKEKILYIVLTMGIPLKVTGGGRGFGVEHASVDSELTLLYSKLHGAAISRSGALSNPFFGRRDEAFRHPRFSIYLVARLAAYDVTEVKALIDRSLAAHNRGKFVLDLSGSRHDQGNDWLQNTALLLPASRVVIDESATVVYDQHDVIGYAAWGSNDGNRRRRKLGFQWLPGAVATEFVSTNARTLHRPPAEWNFGSWLEKNRFFGGSPQSLTADYIDQGATAATGNTYEPYLVGCARPDYLLPAYYQGRNLVESYYLSIQWLSWQGVLLGDPLCSLGKP